MKMGMVGLLLLAIIVPVAMAQESGTVKVPNVMEKHFADDGLGGEGILKNVKTIVDKDYADTKFEVEVQNTGKYYIAAWVMGVNGQKKIQAYLDTNLIGYLDISDNGWQVAQLQNNNTVDSIDISKGTHIISFRSQEVPTIEFVRLANQKDKAIPSDKNYRDYTNTLKAKSLPDTYGQLKTKNQLENYAIMAITNPEGDYAYQLETNFAYTYYNYFYLYSGQNVIFETKKSNPYASDPVMFLFNYNDPVNGGSWSNDDGGVGHQSKLSVTIPRTGWYMLLLRSYSSSYPGTSDLYKDGYLYNWDVPLAGTNVYSGSISKTGILNYFTSHLTGDSRIWLEDSSSFPGKIKGFNDDYFGSGDFYWGPASRVKNAFSTSINYVLVSAYSSYSPTGKADLYMKLDNSDIMSAFPNLKADDAIKSAPTSSTYNCISWSGGITNAFIWPPDIGSPWYSANPLTAFDKFYGNNPRRYIGAWTYTRSGATQSNSIVDLWANSGGYTHGSVRKPGNDNPHGYDWESKPGGAMRTFHPRYALRGNAYGNVVANYRLAGTYPYVTASNQTEMTLSESVDRGLTVIEKVELSTDEKVKIENLIKNIPEKVKQEFDTKYIAWKATWNDPDLIIQSNPKMYTQSRQYNAFLTFSKKQGKPIWPLLFQKYDQGDFLVEQTIIDLTYTNYGSLLDEIRNESTIERFDAQGAYIAPSENANMMKYIKKLLTI